MSMITHRIWCVINSRIIRILSRNDSRLNYQMNASKMAVNKFELVILRLTEGN